MSNQDIIFGFGPWGLIYGVQRANVERISFEEAKGHENYRQQYLDQLLQEESKSIREWTGFNGLVYDPGLRECKQRNKREGVLDDVIENRKKLAGTPIIKGEKSFCYISELCFDWSEDEVKSLLDHEAFHAYTAFKQELPVKTSEKPTGNESSSVWGMAFEVFAFDYQFFRIATNKRKVRKKFIDVFGASYTDILKRFKLISKQDDDDGRFARLVLSSLKVNLHKEGENYVIYQN